MKNRYLFICGLSVFIGLGLLTRYRSHGAEHAVMPSVAQDAQGSSKAKIAPEFTLRTLDGRSVKLSDFRGKAVLLNFWATWCAPCRVEMPWFVEFYKQYRPQGLEIVGVSMDDAGQETAIADFVKERNVDYTILRGNNDVADLYGGVRFLPQSYFIDRGGNIVKTTFGIESREAFEESIKQLLGAKDGHP